MVSTPLTFAAIPSHSPWVPSVQITKVDWTYSCKCFNAMVHMGPAFDRSQAPCTPAPPLSVHSSRVLGLGPSLDLCFSICRMVGGVVRYPLGSLDHPVVPRRKLRCWFPWHGLPDSPCRYPWSQTMGVCPQRCQDGAELLLIISF